MPYNPHHGAAKGGGTFAAGPVDVYMHHYMHARAVAAASTLIRDQCHRPPTPSGHVTATRHRSEERELRRLTLRRDNARVYRNLVDTEQREARAVRAVMNWRELETQHRPPHVDSHTLNRAASARRVEAENRRFYGILVAAPPTGETTRKALDRFGAEHDAVELRLRRFRSTLHLPMPPTPRAMPMEEVEEERKARRYIAAQPPPPSSPRSVSGPVTPRAATSRGADFAPSSAPTSGVYPAAAAGGGASGSPPESRPQSAPDPGDGGLLSATARSYTARSTRTAAVAAPVREVLPKSSRLAMTLPAITTDASLQGRADVQMWVHRERGWNDVAPSDLAEWHRRADRRVGVPVPPATASPILRPQPPGRTPRVRPAA